ncbi:MAG: hypothetical protein A4E30_00577 [Methanomassiliicoccales archaeon PtaB.Bin215]|nr:MAG: hypothetical protein A4E30_00577 [Methanomassiliicoccales archaeon PtaB.Bin215]
MLVREEARAVWDAASRKAFWNQLLSNIGGGQQSLLDFNEVARHLRLRTEVSPSGKKCKYFMCQVDVARLTFRDGRFEIEVEWRDRARPEMLRIPE